MVYDTDSLPRVFKPNDKKGPIVFTGKVDGAVYAELRHPKVAQPLPFFVENAEISISYNADNPEPPLAISWGSAVYDPATDADYRAVFKRADEAMYAMKNEYYRTHGGRGGTVITGRIV